MKGTELIKKMIMDRHWLTVFFIAFLMTVIVLTGCTGNEDIVPLPSSAKHFAPDGKTLEPNQITIPFPYTDKRSNSEERWFVDRDTSGNLVLKITWQNREVAAFPLNSIGENQLTDEITLVGKTYKVINIVLHNDNIPYASGWVTLQES